MVWLPEPPLNVIILRIVMFFVYCLADRVESRREGFYAPPASPTITVNPQVYLITRLILCLPQFIGIVLRGAEYRVGKGFTPLLRHLASDRARFVFQAPCPCKSPGDGMYLWIDGDGG